MTLNWEKTRFITTLIIGFSFLEYILTAIEILAFLKYGFYRNIIICILGNLLAPYLANLCQIIIYLALYRKQEDV